MDIPPVEAYVSGFRAGVKTAQKARGQKIEAIVATAGSFNDPVKGKSLAKAMIDRGADVIFRAAGNTGIGVTEAVKGTGGVYMVAEDLDQDAEIPGRVLASALKRMDVAVYGAIRDAVEGRLQGGHRWLGASEGAIDMTEMKYSRQLFDPADLQRIEKAKKSSSRRPTDRSEAICRSGFVCRAGAVISVSVDRIDVFHRRGTENAEKSLDRINRINRNGHFQVVRTPF